MYASSDVLRYLVEEVEGVVSIEEDVLDDMVEDIPVGEAEVDSGAAGAGDGEGHSEAQRRRLVQYKHPGPSVACLITVSVG